jgi:hypothetical protein
MLEAGGTLVAGLAASWLVISVARRLMRRAARRALATGPQYGRVRHGGASAEGQPDPRLLQRADALGSLIGRLAAAVIMLVAMIVALQRVGVDPVVAISSAGFLGLAVAFGGQAVISDFLAGARALIEDRYAIGDEVVVRVAGIDVRGTVDLVGATSVRLRLTDGSAWHTGHGVIDCVSNSSQTPAKARIALPLEDWQRVDVDEAASRLASSSNGIGLTGVVFLPDLEVSEPTDEGRVVVDVRANRPLTASQEVTVRDRLLGRQARHPRRRRRRG